MHFKLHQYIKSTQNIKLGVIWYVLYEFDLINCSISENKKKHFVFHSYIIRFTCVNVEKQKNDENETFINDLCLMFFQAVTYEYTFTS